MLKEDAIALVHKLENAVNAHDVVTLLNFYAENAATVSPVYGEVFGRTAIRKSWETIFSLFPDWMVKVLDVLLDGNRVAFVGMASATDRNG
jgi:ketosteroid isomerase-like protein